MKPTKVFNVVASLPQPLEALRELTHNLRWAWNHETLDLFRRIDSDLWEECEHNPVRLLGMVSQQRLQECAQDEGVLAHLERAYRDLGDYMGSPGWARRAYEVFSEPVIAYFSAEFGITECLALYSGGLGVLSGDTLKSASDVGLPLVGVGLLYGQGYFTQYLNADGWQQEAYKSSDFYTSPIIIERRDDTPVRIEFPFLDGTAKAQVWRVQVGRIPLFLLDTNIDENPESARRISGQLYGGGGEMRIQQEILLGIGGARALRAVGIAPEVYHLNEGHSVFLGLERIRVLMQEHNLSFDEARIGAGAGLVFTTHTPVPAGSDRFGRDMVQRYLGKYLADMGVSVDQVMYLGSENPSDSSQPLCTTALALRLAAFSFGVSELHGRTSRRIWGHVWPNVPEKDVPIELVTNGVHIPTWVSREMAGLFDRYLGPRWLSQPAEPEDWEHINDIPDEELWQTHERRRQRLVAFARRRLHDQLLQRGATPAELRLSEEALQPHALTMVVARRFATYKRATLLFRDMERLRAIVTSRERPVQIIFAGKAHPADNQGKEVIREIVHRTRDKDLRARIVFVENYDMAVARYLAEGADVWLNMPRRPLEASGTSGMKAAANGALNVSILDGWWCEGYARDTGWAIGRGEEYADPEYQDAVESQALYDLLEKETVPLFYDRGPDDLPRRWIAMMKAAIRKICPVFNGNRMVREYMEHYYLPATIRSMLLKREEFKRARGLAAWQRHLREAWPQVAVREVHNGGAETLHVGSEFTVRVLVHLGKLAPEDVAVDLYLGRVDTSGDLSGSETTRMDAAEKTDDGNYWFVAKATCRDPGRQGFSVRILPRHEDQGNPYEMNLVHWA